MLAKVPRPYSKKNIQNIKVFYEPYLLEDLNSILDKIIEPIVIPEIKKKWLSYSNSLLPKNSLNYSSQEDYLKTTNLSKIDIIKNTIKYVLPDLSKFDVDCLAKEFLIFTKKDKIFIINDKSRITVIYNNIFHSLNYMKKIKVIMDKNNKVRSSNHLGIKKSSNWKALVKSEKKALEYRLNHPYFPITNKDEIDKTKSQVSYLEKILDKKYKILIDLYNFANIYFGLDYPPLNLTEKEQEKISQLLSLLNGLKTSNEELMISTKIFLRNQSNIVDKNSYKELSQSILNIIIQVFNEEYIKATKKRKKRINHFTYTKNEVDKPIRVKTFIDDIPIYTYSKSNYFDFLKEFYKLFFKSFSGEKNIFEPHLPKTNPTIEFTILKNFAILKKDFNFTKREISSFNTIIDFLIKDSEKI